MHTFEPYRIGPMYPLRQPAEHYLLQAKAIGGRPGVLSLVPKEALRQILLELKRVPSLERSAWPITTYLDRIEDFARIGLSA